MVEDQRNSGSLIAWPRMLLASSGAVEGEILEETKSCANAAEDLVPSKSHIQLPRLFSCSSSSHYLHHSASDTWTWDKDLEAVLLTEFVSDQYFTEDDSVFQTNFFTEDDSEFQGNFFTDDDPELRTKSFTGDDPSAVACLCWHSNFVKPQL